GRSIRTGPLCAARGKALRRRDGHRPPRSLFPREGGRRMRPLRSAVVVLTVLICALPVRAQSADADFWPRTHIFRRLFSALHLTALNSEQQLAADPSRTVLVILGRPTTPRGERVLDRIPGGLRHFVEEGGAVLIASDHHFGHAQLSALSGHFVNGEK